MSRRFQDRVVFVTGGSSGLGADTCELFLNEGAKVFVTDIQERDILKRLGSNAHFHTCDVSDPKSCSNAVQACIDKYGKLDVLFHNAARLSPITTVVDHDIATFQEVINTNLCGAFYLAKAAIPQMRKQGKGVIINTTSVSGIGGDFGLSSYNAAKGGLINLTKTMAIDHAREGIRILSVAPGFMATAMTAGVTRTKPKLQEAIDESIPMGRGGDPKEIGRVVLFLASDDASYVIGHPFIVDGGWNARNPSPNYYKHVHE